jgi:hypothetical protein
VYGWPERLDQVNILPSYTAQQFDEKILVRELYQVVVLKGYFQILADLLREPRGPTACEKFYVIISRARGHMLPSSVDLFPSLASDFNIHCGSRYPPLDGRK